ncbi:uncharacterized protein [Drosophila bipectinata]|uniref:uncharacterized protein n=1 Tax=Drosophila bipectinata TaxID=42026 RepID=UPI0007E7F92F|nr:uncharacterized protein LOC108126608 [Drosophila bipectinata]
MLYTIIAFFVAYLLMITLYLVEPIEYAHPWNYIIVTVCYELLTLGCSTFVQDWHILYTVVSICFALGLTIIGLGVCFPLIWFSKYPNPVKTATFVSMCFALVYCTMNMKLIKEWLFWVDFAVAIFIFSAMIRLISHVMITDENFEKLIVDDIMVTAFKLYINFCLIFIGCAIAVDCIRLNTDWIVKE